jgi:hypothetical protein
MCPNSLIAQEFVAHPEPTRGECDELARKHTNNPFFKFEWALDERLLSGCPWLLATGAAGHIEDGCIGFIRDGFSERTLTIPSAPPVGDAFWEALCNFCVAECITLVRLNSYASSLAVLPGIGQELQRTERFEFLLPLMNSSDDELLSGASSTHRRLIRKAAKAGLVLRKAVKSDALGDHMRLTGASFDRRRARGELVPTQLTEDAIGPYLRSGWCELFQVVERDQVVSSMTIAKAKSGAYLHTSGSSEAGMAMGASHFLVFEIAKLLRSAGIDEFNLGGVTDLSSGLARYKSSFGCKVVRSEAAVSRFGGRSAKLRHSSSQLVKKAFHVLVGRTGSSQSKSDR